MLIFSKMLCYFYPLLFFHCIDIHPHFCHWWPISLKPGILIPSSQYFLMSKGLLISWERHDNNGEHSFERGRQGGKAVAWPKPGKEVKQRTTFRRFPSLVPLSLWFSRRSRLVAKVCTRLVTPSIVPSSVASLLCLLRPSSPPPYSLPNALRHFVFDPLLLDSWHFVPQ